MTGTTATGAAPRRRLNALAASRSGNLSIEFAFLFPLLLMLAFGALEVGNVLLQQLRMSGAARAGLQYGLQDHATAVDTSGIIQAARGGGNLASADYAVTPRKFCDCGTGEVSCATGCVDGTPIRTYLEVLVTGRAKPLISYPFAVTSWNLSARQTQRLN